MTAAEHSRRTGGSSLYWVELRLESHCMRGHTGSPLLFSAAISRSHMKMKRHAAALSSGEERSAAVRTLHRTER